MGFREKVKKKFQDLTHKVKEDIEIFYKRVDISIIHWCENHTKCNHGKLIRKRYQLLDIRN